MRRERLAAIIAVACLATFGAQAAFAADDHDSHPQTTFRARLRPGSEVPLCSSTGSGRAKLTIDDDAQTIEFPVRVAPDGEAVVTYRVRYTW